MIHGMKNEKIIVVKEKRSGCGSMLLVIILAFMGIGAYIAMQKPEPASASVKSGPLLPGEKPLEQSLVDLQLMSAVRKNLDLKDPSSYRPGKTKVVRFRGGWMYVQPFKAANSFGVLTDGIFGIAHGTDGKWTFYSAEDLTSVQAEIQGAL